MQEENSVMGANQMEQGQPQNNNNEMKLNTVGEHVVSQPQQEEQQQQEIMDPDEKALSEFREKEMARMNAGLEKLGKKGHITIEDFAYDCVVYDGGEGWKKERIMGCKLEGVIDGNRIEANTDKGKDPKEGIRGIPELTINGEEQPSKLFKEFLETYAPFAYNIKKEKELINKQKAKKIGEMLNKEQSKKEEERKKQLEKAREILF